MEVGSKVRRGEKYGWREGGFTVRYLVNQTSKACETDVTSKYSLKKLSS